MSRWSWCSAPLTVVLATLMMPSAWAQQPYNGVRYGGPAQQVSQEQMAPQPMNGPQAGPGYYAPPSQPGYVQLGGALYPSPRPNIPVETGITYITSQALAPHEMLYPHTYRSLHGPYYHKVTGGYIWTPFGMRTHEKWELQGTMVQVKYRSQQPFFRTLLAPTTSMNGGEWR